MNVRVRYLSGIGVEVAAYASRVCVGGRVGISLDNTYDQNCEYLMKRIAEEHESVIEHIVYSFEVEWISRALLQELSRHRHISLSVLSTRWAMKKSLADGGCDYFVPPNMEEEDYAMYLKAMNSAIACAMRLANKYGNDTGKYALPECLYTKLVMTVNMRELRYMYKLRTSDRALPEFRDLMKEIVATLPENERRMVTE